VLINSLVNNVTNLTLPHRPANDHLGMDVLPR